VSKSRYVTGLRAVEQFLARQPENISRLYAEYQTSNPRLEAIVADATSQGIDIQSANRARLSQISGDARHQGVIAEIVREQLFDEAALRTFVEDKLSADESLLILVLDGVQDPHNLGACLRTADAAGVDAAVIPRHGAAGLGPTVSKVAAGAAETVPVAAVANIAKVLTWLRDYDVAIVGTSDAASDAVFSGEFSGPLALVMGGEHSGLRQAVKARCTQLVSIPMAGSVPSLNVSVAAGVCLFEVVRQRQEVRPAD